MYFTLISRLSVRLFVLYVPENECVVFIFFSQYQEDGRLMVEQQVNNALRHLEKAHGIQKHLVTEDVLPKGTPPHSQVGNTCLVLGMFHLVYVSSGLSHVNLLK